jgi:WD40 repeat protein
MRYSPDGKSLAISSLSTKQVLVRECSTGRVHAALPHPNGVRGVAWSPDGARLAAACGDYNVYVWRPFLDPERPLAVLRGHRAETVCVDFSRGGELVASNSWDGSARIWDAWTGKCRLVVPRPITSLCFGTSGDRIGFGHSSWTGVELHELATGRECRTFSRHEGGKGPRHVSLDASGRILTSASADGIRFWNARTGEPLGFVPGRLSWAALFSPDGRFLITAGETGLYRWPVSVQVGAVTRYRIGPRSALIEEDNAGFEMADLSRDGNVLAVAQPGRSRVLVLRDWRTKPRIERLETPKGVSPALDPSGRLLVVGTWHGSGLRVFDLETNRLIREIPTAGDARPRFGPDGKDLYYTDDGGLSVVSTESFEVRPFRSSPPLYLHMAVSPDGRMIAASERGGRVWLLRTRDAGPIASFRPQDDRGPPILGFSGDGCRLAGGCDRIALVWDLREMRRKLAEVSLDWEGTGLPPEEPAGLSVEIAKTGR